MEKSFNTHLTKHDQSLGSLNPNDTFHATTKSANNSYNSASNLLSPNTNNINEMTRIASPYEGKLVDRNNIVLPATLTTQQKLMQESTGSNKDEIDRVLQEFNTTYNMTESDKKKREYKFQSQNQSKESKGSKESKEPKESKESYNISFDHVEEYSDRFESNDSKFSVGLSRDRNSSRQKSFNKEEEDNISID
jgi:hypothetical protein